MTCRYLVLAYYDPLSDRELGLRQTELVDLLKTGCAGWWFVRLVRAPYSQGWAPSTYLQQIDEMWEGRLPADNWLYIHPPASLLCSPCFKLPGIYAASLPLRLSDLFLIKTNLSLRTSTNQEAPKEKFSWTPNEINALKCLSITLKEDCDFSNDSYRL